MNLISISRGAYRRHLFTLLCVLTTLGIEVKATAIDTLSSDNVSADSLPRYEENVLTGGGIDTARNFKVGLVLSGGGAKGIAHVGVIKALEDNDIPIDCVTGTSMGSIVGSLYACGYSPAQMMQLFKSKVFLNCATGTLDPAKTYYFSRPTPTPAWAQINISLKDSVHNNIVDQIIPSSLINPLPMNIEFINIFSRFTAQCNENFDNLMVPFRCVTSDVYHKHKVVMRGGSLSDAVRASMSFPLVFRPIKIDGLLMYDGGIYDNFPVDVMQEDFDPDFIIGVSVSGPDGKPESGNLMSQLEDMIIQNNDYNVPSENGIKIQCPVLEFGVLDFTQADVIYDIGYRTGLAMVDSIKKRIPQRRPLQEVERKRSDFAAHTPQIMFDSVAVTSGTPGQRKFLQFLFNRGFADRPFGMDQTYDAYYRAVSGGKLSNLMPAIEFGAVDPASPLLRKNNTLVLSPDIKSPWNIGVGGWLTTNTQSMLYLNLGYHTLSFNSLDVDLSGWVGQSYYAGQLSGKFTIHSRLPAYMKIEAVASRMKLYNSQLMFFQENTPTFITETEKFFRLHYCLATGRKSIAKAQLSYGWKDDKYYPVSDIDFSSDNRDLSKYRIAALQLGWEYNTLSNQIYPMSGRELNLELRGMNINSDFLPNGKKEEMIKFGTHYRASAELKWREYFNIHRNFKIGGFAQALITLGPLYQSYTAELITATAFAPTPSLGNTFNPRFRSNNFTAIGFMPIWNPFEKLQFRGDFYGYLPIRNIEADSNGAGVYKGWFNKPAFIGEIAAVYNFSFASLSIYGNYLSSPRKNWNFGVSFGFYFLAPKLAK